MTINSIPASQIVDVRPSILPAGGAGLQVIALLLTTSSRVPTGTVKPFADLADVQAFFGEGSAEALAAAIYFNGFDGSSITPSSVLFTQYNTAGVGAYLRGGNLASLTEAEWQAITAGTLTVTIDGDVYTTSTLNLSAATTLSIVASDIATALNTAPPNAATFTATIASTTMTVTAVASGTLIPGQLAAGSGITGSPTILTQLTSTETDGHFGGKGTYSLSHTETVGSPETVTTTATISCSYDSLSGSLVLTSGTTGALSTIAFATGNAAATLEFTSATGAVLSQGAGASVPGAFMDNILNVTQNWVTFMLTFDPDNGSGNTQKMLFVEWNNDQDDEFAFVCWDTDASPTVTVPATNSMGYLIKQGDYSGTYLIWAPAYDKAAFSCGIGASINFEQFNGRTTWDLRSQEGLTPDVFNATIGNNLLANGYNFYGGYATRVASFNQMTNGAVSGDFTWMDTYVNQIQFNSSLQNAILIGLRANKSIPYNSKGYALVESWCMDPINSALNFGTIRPGVTLSNAQIAEINQAAGANIATIVQSRGWYLQVADASPTVRAQRGSPPCTLWYSDGGSIQKIVLDSIVVQ